MMFGSDFSIRQFADPGFGRTIAWDVPLLEGYSSEVLPALGRTLADNELPSFWRPLSHGITRRLKAGRFDALWVHGYNRASHWAAIVAAKRLGLGRTLAGQARRQAGVLPDARPAGRRLSRDRQPQPRLLSGP
ncbi:MAG: hypothetical protein WDO24_19555 [Pseudomonadota bacterium]